MTDDIKSSPPLDEDGIIRKNIALSHQQAHRQLKQGKATSQTMKHYADIDLEIRDAEMERLRLQNELLKAKIEAERSNVHTEESVNRVLNALKGYMPPDEYRH
jgi:hypothetical protein